MGNCLENFLPAIVQHAAARGHLSPTDIFDGFLAGHLAEDDNASDAGMFTYSWKRGQAKLDVSIDWRRRHVAAVATNAWIARCVVARELPFEVCYYIKNWTEASMECRWRVHPGRSHEMQAIPAGGVSAGFIRIADPPGSSARAQPLIWSWPGPLFRFECVGSAVTSGSNRTPHANPKPPIASVPPSE